MGNKGIANLHQAERRELAQALYDSNVILEKRNEKLAAEFASMFDL